MKVRVLIADDEPLIRAGMSMILEEFDDLEVVGTARDGDDAVRLADTLAPDVVVMDVRMPVMDGIEATARILAADPSARVLAVTTFDLDEHAFAALRAGASGFILKNVAVEALADAIRTVARGDAVVSPRITRRLLEVHAAHLPADVAGNDPDGPGLDRLTSRERDVLLQVAAGLSNAEIAEELVVSEATVKTHVSSMLTKLGLRSRVQAVIYAYDHGLVQPTRRN